MPDIALYQHADSLPEGKSDKNFLTKPELALSLINQTLKRKYYPGLVLIDGGYGNNSNFLTELEKLKLKYIGGLGKNRLTSIIEKETGDKKASSRLDEIIL